MADADGACDAEVRGNFGDVLTEGAPGVRRLGLGAATVPAQVDGNGAAAGQGAGHLVPTTGVESGGVREK
jgi:hypothetical protein